MRISFGQTFDEGLRALEQAAEQYAEAQRRVASGRRLERAGDDPAGMAAAIAERTRLAAVDAYTRAADAASSQLSVADAVLSDILNQLTAAKVAAVAASGTDRTPEQRNAMSAEVRAIRDTIFADINMKFGDTYLFAGTASTAAPFTASGGTYSGYLGSSSAVYVDVASGHAVPVTFDGGALMQGSDAVHLLDALTALAAAIQGGDPVGIQQGIDAIDRAFSRVTRVQADVGVAQRTLDRIRPQVDAARSGGLLRLSRIEDANMAEAITDLTRAETAQRAAMSAFAARQQLTLMDYLK